MKSTALTVVALIQFIYISAQTTRVVRPGNYNVPITEVQFEYDGTTITQTSEASGTIANTNKAVDITYVKINDNGSVKTLNYFNDLGGAVANNNFASNVSGVGVYNLGTSTYANATDSWTEAMIESGMDKNFLNYIFYDRSKNVPSGADFDIQWTKGWESSDYILVGERNGNTCFALTPLDSNGEVITSAYKLQFGNCFGSVRSEYDWNLGYAPTNITNQPMVVTVIKMSEFNTNRTIFGFRIDNTGDADPKILGLSDEPFVDNPNNPKIGGLSGNVFNDLNGLVNNRVDGNGINSVESNTIYANLVNNSNQVISTVAVGSDGYYEFLNLDSGTYNVVISTTQGTVGQTAPSPALPVNWVYTGDNIGAGNGNDGNADGELSNILIQGDFVEEVNVGINKRPNAVDRQKIINSPDYGTTLALTADNDFPGLLAQDLEDGDLGIGNTLVITDTTNMNGNVLLYDGQTVELNTTITNFDPTKLQVRFTGDFSTSFEFDYYFVDGAGLIDLTPATYTIQWMTALPVEWFDYSASYDASSNAVVVKWSTVSELNNSHFVILRSNKAGGFQEIGMEQGQGTASHFTEYQFVDYNVEQGQTYYYQIKQVDFDGQTDLTSIMIVDLKSDNKLRVAPNPFKDDMEITFNTTFDHLIVRDVRGTVVEDFNASIHRTNFVSLETTNWPNGVYFIEVYSNGQRSLQKVVKH